MVGTACHGQRQNSNPAIDSEPLTVERIDLFITDFSTTDTTAAAKYQPGLDIYLAMLGIDKADTLEAFEWLHESDMYRTFGRDVKVGFGPLDEVEKELGTAAFGLSECLPGVDIEKVYGVISPYNQSIVIADSIVFIALNHYMGPTYEAYDGMPAYVRMNKTPERIPVDVAEALIRVNYPYEPSPDATLLERMLYEGAVYAALTGLFDSRDEYSILGVTEEDYKNLRAKNDDNWARLSEAGALYSTQPDVIARLMSPIPDAPLLMPDTPGKAGVFMGMSIIKDYIDRHPDTEISSLLQPDFYTDAQRRLIESR